MAKFFDVHPEDPQPRAISQIVELLRSGGLIAYPTDSCYALGAQLGNKEALDRIRSIRQLDSKHPFTLVCRDFAQLGQVVTIGNDVFRSIKSVTPGSYTFILPATKEVPRQRPGGEASRRGAPGVPRRRRPGGLRRSVP